MVYRNTWNVTLTAWNDKKIFIEITQANINDPDLNINSDWTWIWSIKIADAYPSWNYIKLWETNWSWLLATTVLENIWFNPTVFNNTDLTWLTWNITTTWNITANTFFWDWSNLTWLSAEVSSTSLNYMLWWTWTVWKGYSLVDYEQIWVGTSNDVWSIAQPEVAQSFYAQDIDITTLKLMIKKISSPSDNILLEIQTDNAWVPSWTIVTNWTSNNVAWTWLTTSFVETTFTFASVPTLTAETLYHIVVKRSWADDAVNYYAAESNWSSAVLWTMSKDTWSWANATDDLYFQLYES